MRLGTTDCCLFSEEHGRETLAIYASLRRTAWEAAMEVLYETCCGLDVHKSSITACVLHEQGHKPQKHLQRFGCTTRDLLELVCWLKNLASSMLPWNRPEFIGSLCGTCLKSTFTCALRMRSTSRQSQVARPT